jgi:hypothetical protein
MMEALPRITKIVAGRRPERFLVRRKLIIGGGTLISVLSIRPSVVVAQAGTFSGARKINFSGRQRMLIQRAGKLVCLAHLAPKPLPLLLAAEEALELYHRTEAALREGDEGLGLEPEVNARVIQALAQSSNAFAPS